jgi:hypothetical protein
LALELEERGTEFLRHIHPAALAVLGSVKQALRRIAASAIYLC